MANSTGSAEYMDTDPVLVELIPSDLWSPTYLRLPGILAAATRVNPVRVGEVCAASNEISQDTPSRTPVTTLPAMRISAPSITAYDGEPYTLRAFCSQLVNQINSNHNQFPTEIAKVQFAYQCLGPGALTKMRSLFRCLEDPTIPQEIKTLSEFLSALKQRCQDPGLCEKATRTVETLYQKGMKFHDFITIFEDNMTDSTFGCLDKVHWKIMLERRLSTRLRNALVTAHSVPDEYHAFVAYLREKDAAFQEINYSSKIANPQMPYIPNTPTVLNSATPRLAVNFPSSNELTVSQGGSAMDLDLLSREKGPDGRLTRQAKDARRSLGRCYRCNKNGHLAMNCPLGKKSAFPVSAVEITPSAESESLKD